MSLVTAQDVLLCPGCGGELVAVAGRQVDVEGPTMFWWACAECGWSQLPRMLPLSLVPEDWRG